MGVFSRWKQRRLEQHRRATAPYIEARNEIWTREMARLGEEEFHRRHNAVSDYQIGRTGPSEFEDWQQRLDAEIMARALDLARRQDGA